MSNQAVNQTQEQSRGSGGSGSARLAYLPALDGLRALAVIAVLFYHAAAAWLPGGFLGVEVFFVISGYLITSLLLAEWNANGSIDFKSFWLRRARRLLPAALLLVVTSLGVAAVVLPDELAGLRDDALAAFTYVTNWYLIADNQSYFEAVGRPSLLRHLWSLAVEEQFYLLWPLLFALGMSRLGKRGLLGLTVAGAVASTLWMAALFQPDFDPSRIYYGTDTRASGLLVGAALAFVWVPGRSQSRFARLPVDLVGAVALVGLVVLGLRLDEFNPFLYRGGLALVAATTAVLIAAAVHPRARLLGRTLGAAPLRWVGLRSYGLYLWHWPVFSLTRPQLDLPLDGLALLALRLAATFFLAELSYRCLELPIRHGAMGRSWHALTHARGRRRWWLGVRWASVTTALLVGSVSLGASVANAQPPATPSYLAVESVNTIDEYIPAPSPVAKATGTPLPSIPVPPAATTATASPVLPAATARPEETPPVSPPPTAPVPRPQATPGTGPGRVTAIGDSVMLGAAEQMQDALGALAMDAAIGRQVAAAIEILRAREASGQLGETVVLQLGNNGTFSASQFAEVMKILGPERRVIFVNVKVPRPWEGPNNAVIAEGVRRYPNAALVDWHSASAGVPGLFWDDGIHLRPKGARLFTELILASIVAP